MISRKYNDVAFVKQVNLDSTNIAPKDASLKGGLDNVCNNDQCLQK